MLKRLPENCALLYADLLQKSSDSHAVLLNNGSFVSKNIGGARYWYHQIKAHGGTKQEYLGRETADLLAKIEEVKSQQAVSRPLMEARRRLVAMMSVGGAFLEKGKSSKILGQMADAGLFTGGGILVGSFAFSCYGNMMGVSLSKSLMRTEDMDFSVERTFEVGLNRSLLDDLLAVDSTFRTPRAVNPRAAPFDLISSDGFKIEFLTTKESIMETGAVYVDRFSLYAQPLDYMDYLLENAQPAVVLSGAGIPVRVPDPARFALHKLAISQLRPSALQTKILKDIDQAESIIEVLLEDNPGALILAADALGARDDLLAGFVKKGVDRLPTELRSAFYEVVTLPDVTWNTDIGGVER